MHDPRSHWLPPWLSEPGSREYRKSERGAETLSEPIDVKHTRTCDELLIAYATRGTGPPLLFVRGLNSHVERTWLEPWKRAYFGALARAFEVTVFDARGNGLSEMPAAIDLEGLVDDVRAVAEDAGLGEDVTVYGQGFGSPIAIAFAARHSNRIGRLVLYSAFACGERLGITDEYIERWRTAHGAASAEMVWASYPEVEAIPARLLRDTLMATSPEGVAAYYEFLRGMDVRPLLAHVDVPTLVMQPESAPAIRESFGREVAEGITGARFVPIPSGSYNPWAEEACDPTLLAMSDFLEHQIPLSSPPRPMAVLVTDLVDSTAMTHRLGEDRARDLFRDHDAIVREARGHHHGKEVKHTGDGIMIRFDDPSDAVACATSIQLKLLDRNESLSDDPVHVRVGVVFGEVVQERDGVFGTTVALAVRVMDQARAGEVLVSESVRTALEPTYSFGPARTVELKGFPEPLPVHELIWAS